MEIHQLRGLRAGFYNKCFNLFTILSSINYIRKKGNNFFLIPG